MLQISHTTAPAFRSFHPRDIRQLKALQAYPRPSGWTFHCDRDEDWDLISIQPPPKRNAVAFPADAFRPNDAYLVRPAPEGQSGVLMTFPVSFLGREIAYRSLSSALIGLRGPGYLSWQRCLG